MKKTIKMNKEEAKKNIEDKGYKFIVESEYGMAFANEQTNFCVILLFKLEMEKLLDIKESRNKRGLSLLEELTNKFPFAEKSTIRVILNSDVITNREEVERDIYFFCSILADKIDYLPSKVDKSIVITIDPMANITDTGDYCVDIFQSLDGLAISNFYGFLVRAKNGDVVKYPRVADIKYFRYVANKLYTTIYNA